MEVHAQLGCGFLEPVYQEAAAFEFSSKGISFKKEWNLKINYKDKVLEKTYVANFICYFADFFFQQWKKTALHIKVQLR